MTREQMMDMVIRRYGFEAEETIEFFRLCEEAEKTESVLDSSVKRLYLRLMK